MTEGLHPRVGGSRITPSEEIEYVDAQVTVFGLPFTDTSVSDPRGDAFTREDFEGALDKVSSPVMGKYVDLLPSSEEFIRDKRREAELEDR